jgi:putrescine transport system substrate-binding protein
MSFRFTARLGLFFAAAVSLGALAANAAEDKVVNVYNWSDYIDPDVLTEFTDQTGIKVVYDVYDNNEIVETKLLAGGSGYDIVVPSASNVARQIQAGTLRKVDKAKLPNLVHMWPLVMKRLEAYDPGNQYAVNYMWGTTAIGYNVDKIAERMPDAPLDSWDMIFKPEVISKFADCGVHLLDSSDDLVPAALNYLGLEPNSHQPDDLKKAAELLKTIRPYVQKFHSSEYINALANGDICLAVGYSGDVLQARSRAEEAGDTVHVAYSIPKEGALMWFDSFVIPKDAPHYENALTFINFMEDPENAARNSNYVFYANGNIDSQPHLDKEVIEDPAIYPSQATLEKLYTTTAYEPQVQRLVTRLWTDIKTGN